MNTFRNMATMLAVIVVSVRFVACGPPSGDASIKVTQEGDTSAPAGSTPDTVVQLQTDTVVRERTVIQPADTQMVITPVPVDTSAPRRSRVSADERAAIDRWLIAHADSVNQFGDPIDMVYTGGTPLFNEATGERTDKYEYIVLKHRDRPWMNEPRR